MQRSIPLVLGLVLVATCASPAWAQRGRNAGVNSPYGQFSAAEMQAAGGDPAMASQIRQQNQMMQYQQQMAKQQQQYMQQIAKQQEFFKKHPEAAKALTSTPRPTKKTATKSGKKDKEKTATDAGAATTTNSTGSSKGVDAASKKKKPTT